PPPLYTLSLHDALPISWSQIIGDIDDQRLFLERRQRAPDDWREFGVGEQHLRLAVAEDEGDRLGVEADVDRVQHRVGHRHGEMRSEEHTSELQSRFDLV